MTNEDFIAAREALGLNVDEVAHILDVHRRTVERYEQPPGTSNARKVPPTVARVMRWMREGFRPRQWPRKTRKHS